MESENISPQAEEKSWLFKVTPLSKYLAMALFVLLPFIGGWVGYTSALEQTAIKEDVSGSSNDLENQISEPHNESDDRDKAAQEAIESYVNQKLSTVAVIDTPTSYVQIAVAADRRGSVYCGYDNGPCYFFLQAYNADYPNIKYLGSVDSVGVFVPSSVKFISPTLFQFEMSFGDVGTHIMQVWSVDILTGSTTKISEKRTSVEGT